jgi:hypothetical protein
MAVRLTSVLLAAVLLLIGACGGDDDGDGGRTTTTAQAPASSATGMATLTGSVEATGPFELQYPTSLTCEGVVSAPIFVVPLPGRLGPMDLQWQANVVDLDGAGSYDLSVFAPFTVTVTPDGGAPVTFSADAATTAALVLRADGSGDFTFSGLRDPAGGELRGTTTWACGLRG